MSNPNQSAGIAAFRDALHSAGVRFAVISPGSRSAPLTLSLASDPRFRCLPVIDERSAGFVALGWGKATRMPALVVTTSGTAAANLAPAVHEAREARVPMIAVTADRPPELRGVGEGQTIDQVELFGTSATFLCIDEPSPIRAWADLAGEAVASSLRRRPGPVQVNISLRPPLHDPPIDPADGDAAPPTPIEPEGRVADDSIARLVEAAERPLAVAGRDEGTEGARFAHECERLGIPLIADPLSGAVGGATSVGFWHSVIASGARRRSLAPDLVIRSGDMPTSKALRAWLAEASAGGAEVVQFDPELSFRDPLGSTTRRLETSATATLAAVEGTSASDEWMAEWTDASRIAARVLGSFGDPQCPLSEPAVAAGLVASLGKESVLFSSASMPIRDLEMFTNPDMTSPRILSNRGANGIDGVVSTAVGVAFGAGARTTVLIGDVALSHDQSSLQLLRDTSAPVTVVTVNNGGGAIFDTLPVADRDPQLFEDFFATPPRLPLEGLCRAWELEFHSIDSIASLRNLATAIGSGDGPAVIEVRIDRFASAQVRQEALAAVASALSD